MRFWAARARGFRPVAALLWMAPFWDELSSGFPSLGSAGLRDEFGSSYTELAALLFFAPFALAVFVEAPLLAWSRRVSPRKFTVAAHSAVAVSLLAAGLAQSPWILAVSMALWGTSGGLALGSAQATLMVEAGPARARAMTRWALWAELGDAAGPLVFAGIASLGGGWRAALLTAAGCVAAYSLALWLWLPSNHGAATAAETPATKVSRLRQLSAALRKPRLLAWLLAGALCSLLDEIFVAFGTLHILELPGSTPMTAPISFGICAVASVLSLMWTERLVQRFSPARLLVMFSIGCMLAYGGWLWADSPYVAALFLVLVGVTAAPMYPLVVARGYATLPDDPHLVVAASSLFTPVDLMLPLALGLVADSYGIGVALILLAMQPAGIGITAALLAPPDPQPERSGRT